MNSIDAVVYLLCSDVDVDTSPMSKALDLLTPQCALTLLGTQNESGVDMDAGLDWDPLSTHADLMTKLLTDERLSTGHLTTTGTFTCALKVMSLSTNVLSY